MNNFKGETLSWDQKDGIIELALHRPPANEIGPATLAELQKFVAALESDHSDASALIIYSQLNSGFSAGGNLRELYAYAQRATPTQRAASIRVLIELSHGLFNAIDAAPVVTIAAVHGMCFGGGFELVDARLDEVADFRCLDGHNLKSSSKYWSLSRQFKRDALEPTQQGTVYYRIAGAQHGAADQCGVRGPMQPHRALELALQSL